MAAQPAEQSKCTICQECVTDERSSPSSCAHEFHTDCITQWSQISNTCPICKTRFTEIRESHTGHITAVSHKNQRVEDHEALRPTEDYQDDRVCEICRDGDSEYDDRALICDGCDKVWHTFCIGLGDRVPSGDMWFCSDCYSVFVESTTTNANGLQSSTGRQTGSSARNGLKAVDHRRSGRYYCPRCDRDLGSARAWRRHVDQCMGNGPTYACRYCTTMVRRLDNLIRHERRCARSEQGQISG